MKLIRKAADRGQTKIDWLDSKHTFSFGRYRDPEWMGFGPLRVINDDQVAPGAGFAPHSHANMEIISYVLYGKMAHDDSMGNGSTITTHEVQVMSAGSGIEHSEFNANDDDIVHFYQIWIEPNVRDETPTYQQRLFKNSQHENAFFPVITPNGEGSSLKIKQDASISIGRFDLGQTVEKPLDKNRKYWFQIAEGNVTINNIPLTTGDGMGLSDEDALSFIANDNAHVLMFDLVGDA
jgi:redox-sensitive bicupin YhaK (pirin superfamily)